MKRLLVALCLLLLPVLATAQHREALLTADGTLFTIESRPQADAEAGAATRSLVLRTVNAELSREEIVPATLSAGAHMEPAIAYDGESRTLFVFWLHHTGIMASQLMFACRTADGTWSEASSFGEQFDFRENLRIAVTRKVTEEDGTAVAGPAVSVHLVWWEFNSDDGHESARYAMLAIENGAPAGDLQYLDLAQYRGENTSAPAPDASPDRTILKQPLLFSAPTQDSVLVVFGDFDTNQLHQVDVRPTRVKADGRLRVPVGRHQGGVGRPQLQASADSRVEGISEVGGRRMAIYTRGATRLDYAILKDGSWSAPQGVTLDDQLTASAAVDALRRLLSEH